MSRHSFVTHYQNRAVEVVLGYDRPLDHFFLTILFAGSVRTRVDERDCDAPPRDADDDIVVYSNLADPEAGFGQGIDYYRAKLTSLGITVPESMFRETEQDAIRRAGNRLVHHHDNGRLETIQEG